MHTIHPKFCDISNFQYYLGQIGWIVCTLGCRVKVTVAKRGQFNCDIDILCTLWSTYRNMYLFIYLFHLFWSCPYSASFWSDFCSFVRHHNIMPSFQICFENILLVFFFTYDMSFHKEYYLIHLLLLLPKFSRPIHKCKYGETNISNFKLSNTSNLFII